MIRWINNSCLLIVSLAVVLSLSGCGRSTVNPNSDRVSIRLPDRYLIKAEVADTASEREQGLSGRSSLAADAGMWFVFDQMGRYPFWIIDMNFSIDIIWVDDALRVVEIDRNISPEPGVAPTHLKRYVNQFPARYVLEVPYGTALDHKIKAGDKFVLIS